MKLIIELIEQADVVFGAWEAPEGVGTWLIKGRQQLEALTMAGRPMRGYVNVPDGWTKRTAATRKWIETSLAWSRQLPA